MSLARTGNRARLMITFAHIVDCGGISAAALRLKLDKAAVSRQLRQLEDQLSVRLLHRTTRQLKLSEAGAVIYERAQRVLHEVQHADLEAQALRAKPSGVLTISAPVASGKMQLVPLVMEFMQRYPDIEMQICLADRPLDAVEEGMDVLLRLCDAPPQHLVAHHLCEVQYVIVAAPELLGRGPTVLTHNDLEKHNCLFYGLKNRRSIWRFNLNGEAHSARVNARVSVNSNDSIRELALQGLGIALVPYYAVAQDLQMGSLVRLLSAYEVVGNLGHSLYALHLPGRFITPKVRVFVEFVRQQWTVHRPTSALRLVGSVPCAPNAP